MLVRIVPTHPRVQQRLHTHGRRPCVCVAGMQNDSQLTRKICFSGETLYNIIPIQYIQKASTYNLLLELLGN